MTMTERKKVDEYGFRFREWDVYTDSRLFRNKINEILKSYPKSEIYALTDQTKRALNSIVLNIAESTNKSTDKDMRLYINRAHCSLDEVVSCLDCALDDGYISEVQHSEFLEEARSLAKRLRKFTGYLSSPASKSSSLS